SGAAATALLQSSAATTLMLIGFVSAGLMTFRQTLGVILGADIGTTLTVQLIAFRITDYSPLLVGLGFTATFIARRRVPKDLGQALLGLGLVFLGLKLILDNAGALRASPLALDLLAAVAQSPAIGVLVGAVFSALVASTAGDPARQIANAHTFFNVGISFLFLPFTPLAARAIETLVPDDQQGDSPFRVRYLDERSLDQPSLALGQATREALRMADVVQGMLRDVPVVFASSHHELLEDVERRDDQVDFLEREIKLFLARLGRDAMGADLSRK